MVWCNEMEQQKKIVELFTVLCTELAEETIKYQEILRERSQKKPDIKPVPKIEEIK